MYNPYQYQSYQQYQPMQSAPQHLGTWTTARDYNAVQNAPIPADGSQVMFMLENDPIFYVCYMQGGRRMVQGYTFKALDTVETKEPMTNLIGRLEALEEKLTKITNDLGVETDESSSAQQQ